MEALGPPGTKNEAVEQPRSGEEPRRENDANRRSPLQLNGNSGKLMQPVMTLSMVEARLSALSVNDKATFEGSRDEKEPVVGAAEARAPISTTPSQAKPASPPPPTSPTSSPAEAIPLPQPPPPPPPAPEEKAEVVEEAGEGAAVAAIITGAPKSDDEISSAAPSTAATERQFALKILVPGAISGCLIGRGGAIINQVQTATSTKIKLSQNNEYFPGTRDRVGLITGDPDNIIAAVADVVERLVEKQRSIRQLIGRRGYVEAGETDEEQSMPLRRSVSAPVPGRWTQSQSQRQQQHAEMATPAPPQYQHPQQIISPQLQLQRQPQSPHGAFAFGEHEGIGTLMTPSGGGGGGGTGAGAGGGIGPGGFGPESEYGRTSQPGAGGPVDSQWDFYGAGGVELPQVWEGFGGGDDLLYERRGGGAGAVGGAGGGGGGGGAGGAGGGGSYIPGASQGGGSLGSEGGYEGMGASGGPRKIQAGVEQRGGSAQRYRQQLTVGVARVVG
ncbi:unnamed protein product [Phaeothamnion confervicola]